MSTPSKTGERKDGRAERLAAALRENLKRRKAKARSQPQSKEQTEAGDEPG